MSDQEPTPAASGDHNDADAAPKLSAALGAAAGRGGLGALASGEAPSGDALLKAMGGVRGLCEAVLPGLAFIVLYTVLLTPAPNAAVPIALGASVLVAVVFTVWRVATRSNASQAVAGLIGVGVSAILAIVTNKPSNNFLLGLGIDALYGLAFLVSVLVRWPVVGLVVGYFYGDGAQWRRDRGKYRAFVLGTLLLVALFAARLVVQVPLYLADNTAALAITHLVMGVPLYVPVLLVVWLLVRSVYPPKQGAETPGSTSSGS